MLEGGQWWAASHPFENESTHHDYASEQNNVEESERSKVYTPERANVRLRTIAGEGSTQY